MKEQINNESELKDVPEDIPEAVVQTRRQISIVWLVPVVAILIGGWLAYKAISEKGPTITITFRTAEGLEAGKTKIKYKDVEIGQVQAITLSENLTHVEVSAEVDKRAEKYLTDRARFWVVRARVAAGEVSGLGTLFSGAYIGMDPGKSGEPTRHFEGLEIPPVVTTGLPGRHFVLKAKSLSSLDIGSPIYYRQIKVGQVVGYHLDEGGQLVRLRAFVNAPHHELVRKNTKFWNAGGLDVTLDANGIKVRTESFVALMSGGIAFDIPASTEPGDPAQEDDVFSLYEKYDDIYDIAKGDTEHWILQFKGSIRGLAVEAPVELKGIQIGKVTEIKAEFDLETLTPQILVFIETNPAVWTLVGESMQGENEEMEILVAKGLRAQLKTGSLLTGQLFVDFDFHPDAPPASIKYGRKYPEVPTVPAPLEMITASLNQLLNKIEKLPIEEIGSSLKNTVQGAERLVNSAELKQSVVELNETLKNTRRLVKSLNSTVAPELNTTLQQGQKTLADIGSMVNPDTALYRELQRAMKELADAAKSIRVMAEYLERHPDALIYGKGKRQ